MTSNPQEARDDLITYAATTRTVTADGLAPLLDAYRDALLAAAPAVSSVVGQATRDRTAEAQVDRAAVLREAADGFDRHAEQILDGVGDKAVFVAKALRDQAAVWREAAETLRRMADEAQSGRSDVGPSARAGLRDEIADAVMPVLYRAWPWLRAEAEDAAAVGARQPDTQTPDARDVQHMLTRMRANASTRGLDYLLRLIACWAASGEGRDVLVDELVAGGYRLPHACGNCEGIDPDTCLTNPDRAASSAVPGRSAATDTHKETHRG